MTSVATRSSRLACNQSSAVAESLEALAEGRWTADARCYRALARIARQAALSASVALEHGEAEHL